MKNNATAEQLVYGGKDAELLKRFMIEFFPFEELVKAEFFKKEMRNDYYAQAERVCKRFGYKSIFEYGAKEFYAHLSYAEGKRPKGTPFVELMPSIYD